MKNSIFLNTLVEDGGANKSLIFWIIFFVVVGLVLIGLVLFLLNRFVFRKHKAKNILNEVLRKYEYLHSLLIGSDFTTLQRIEQISRTNIIYTDIHTNLFKKFKDVRDVSDRIYGEIVRKLGVLYEDNKIKEFFSLYKEKASTLKTYEMAINNLHKELMEVIKPEEDARQAILPVKEKARELKSLFNNQEYDLFIISQSFRDVFRKVDESFEEYDNDVECANYDEAKTILPKVEGVLNYLLDNFSLLPNLIKQLTNDFPQKINNLKDLNKNLELDGYPLDNIGFEEKIKIIQNKLDKALIDIKKINITKVERALGSIDELISQLKVLFDKEVEAKQIFDAKNEDVLNKFNSFEKSFITLANSLDKISKYYLISEDKRSEFENIKEMMDDVTRDKRRLEIYLHSSNKTPYSILKDKILDLENGTEKIIEKYDVFENYITSLKKDSEHIYYNVGIKYFELKKYEKKLEEINNVNFILSAKKRINEVYANIDEIFRISNETPIDVKYLKSTYNQFKLDITVVFDKIDKLLDDKNKTRDNILLLNRDRLKFSDINALVDQVENLYLSGDYETALNMSNQAISRLKEKNGTIN